MSARSVLESVNIQLGALHQEFGNLTQTNRDAITFLQARQLKSGDLRIEGGSMLMYNGFEDTWETVRISPFADAGVTDAKVLLDALEPKGIAEVGIIGDDGKARHMLIDDLWEDFEFRTQGPAIEREVRWKSIYLPTKGVGWGDTYEEARSQAYDAS
jgi:hypothetical protein